MQKAVTAKDKGEPTFFPGMYEAPHGKARSHSCDPQRISNLLSRANALGERKMAGQNFEGDGWQFSGEYIRGTFFEREICIISSHWVSDCDEFIYRKLTPIGISCPHTTTPSLSTSRDVLSGLGGCKRRPSWMTAWR